jgi:hypothetical protein
LRAEVHAGSPGSTRSGAAVAASPPSFAQQQRDADVAALLAAVPAVLRRQLDGAVGRPARRDDRVGELAQRERGRHGAVVLGARVVLDLLQRDDRRRAQRLDDLARERGEARARRGGGEVLDVVAGDGERALGRHGRGLGRQAAALDGRRDQRMEPVAAPGVAEHADQRRGEAVAGVRARQPGEQIVEQQPRAVAALALGRPHAASAR